MSETETPTPRPTPAKDRLIARNRARDTATDAPPTLSGDKPADTVPRRTVRTPPSASASAGERTSTAKSATDREVETALAVMTNTYDAIAVGLMFSGNLDYVELWSVQRRKLDLSNRGAFEASVDLRKTIIRWGSKSTTGAFIFAHLSALGPIGFMLWSDWQRGRKKAEPKTVMVNAEDAAFTSKPADSPIFNEGFFQ